MDIRVYNIEVYQYKLKNNVNGYIPILLVVSAEDIPHGTRTLTFNGSDHFTLDNTFTYLGSSFPIWTLRGKNYDTPHISNYDDEYFSFLNDSSVRVINPYIKYASNRKILYRALPYDGDVPEYVSYSFIPVFVTDQRRDFYYCNETNGYVLESYEYKQGLPIESFEIPTETSKGAFLGNISGYTFTWAMGSYYSDYANAYNKTIAKILNDSTIYDPDNPYSGGDEPNNPGDGTFNYSSDVIHVPGLPTTSVVDSGLVSLYAPTPAELQALGNYLWSDAFSVDTFKKMFNNPMDCILGLSLIPVKVPTGGSREITVGNIVSTVSCTVCTSQYVEVDCGTFTFNRSNFTGSFLDYSPYLKCFLFLPFIGMNEIDMDEWQNSTMGVVYHVDVLTGAMFCFVTRNGSVIMTYSGQCSENVPLSSNDFTTTIGSILGVASTAVGAVATVATAGASAPAAAVAGGLSEAALGARTGASLAGAGVSTASQVGSMKPSIRHSGCVGGGAGIMGVKAPYLLFIAPRMATPNNQEKYTGFSSNKIVELSTCSGYTEVQAINLHIKNANDMEMAEIENGLKTGVIL